MRKMGEECFYCGAEFSPAEPGTWDHKIPRSRGGGEGDNLVAACLRCNCQKGRRTVDEYRTMLQNRFFECLSVMADLSHYFADTDRTRPDMLEMLQLIHHRAEKARFQFAGDEWHQEPEVINLSTAPIIREREGRGEEIGGVGGRGEGKETIQSRPPKRSELPATLVLTPALKAFAIEKGVREPDRQFAMFQEYHRSRRSLMADWDAAWRTWCFRAVDYQPTLFGKPSNGQGGNGHARAVPGVAATRALLDKITGR